MVVRTESIGPTQCGITEVTTRCTKGGCKPDNRWRMPGAGLSRLIGTVLSAQKRLARVLQIVGAVLCGLVLVFGSYVFGAYIAGRSNSPIGPGGQFHLEDQNGKPVSDQDMKGRPFLVFFGYTHCPDICPTTLFEISEVMKSLGRDADRTGALFITVDPERTSRA